MPTIPINSEIHLEIQTILEGISKLDTASLEGFAQKVNDMLAKRKVPALSDKETVLLKQINEGIDPEILNRFQELQVLQRENNISKSEIKELESLIDTIETAEAKRLEALIALAQVWQTTVAKLRKRLGITISDPYVW